MENQAAKREGWCSLLTGQWLRDYVKRHGVADEGLPSILSVLSSPQRLKELLPGDSSIALQGGLTPGTVEFSVPMPEEYTRALHTWIDMNVVNRQNSVFLDTTCLDTARLLIEDRDEASRYLLPLTLLDLNMFVSCAIMHGRIYHLQNPFFNSQRLKTLFGEDLFYELPVADVRTHQDFQPYFEERGIYIENILESIYRVRVSKSGLESSIFVPGIRTS